MIAGMRIIFLFLGFLVLAGCFWLINGAIDNTRWVKKDELIMPSSSFDTCLNRVVYSLNGVSLINNLRGRYKLSAPFQSYIPGIRIFIQDGVNNKATIMFIADKMISTSRINYEFYIFKKKWSDEVNIHCKDLDWR